MKVKSVSNVSLRLLVASSAVAIALAAWPQAALPQTASAAASERSLAAELQEEFAAVAAKVTPTIVNIDIIRPMDMPQGQEFYERNAPGSPGMPPDMLPPEMRQFFNNPQGQGQPNRRHGGPLNPGQEAPKAHGVGSGVIIDAKNGYVLTNNHVVEKATEIGVQTADGMRYIAKLVGTDPRTELAVVQIKADGLQGIEWGDSDAMKVGYWVFAFGQPEGLQNTVTKGIVSAMGRTNLGIIGAPGGIQGYEDFIQTDAAINPGNSGGPLTDIEGRLIGINSAIATHGAPQWAGIGFAIPSNLARKIAEQLIEHGEVIRGWIGVQIADVSDRDSFPAADKKTAAEYPKDTKGAYVAHTEPAQPAEAAGMKGGDVIVKFAGKGVEDSQKLRYLVADAAVGSEVDVEVLRTVDGKTTTVTLTVKIAKQPETTAAARAAGVASAVGLTVQTLTGDVAESLGFSSEEKGVVITDIEDGSRAAKADLAVGDVISELRHKGKETTIASAEDFSGAVSKVPEKESFVVLRKRQGQTMYVKIE